MGLPALPAAERGLAGRECGRRRGKEEAGNSGGRWWGSIGGWSGAGGLEKWWTAATGSLGWGDLCRPGPSLCIALPPLFLACLGYF